MCAGREGLQAATEPWPGEGQRSVSASRLSSRSSPKWGQLELG